MKEIVNIAEDLLLGELASDLLYLYFAGGWYDTIKAIETAELISLVAIILFSLTQLVFHVRRLFKR